MQNKRFKEWFIRLGFVDDDFKKRVKSAAKRERMTISEYVTAVLEEKVGEMPVKGRKGFRE